MNIELNYEQIDNIVVKELKTAVEDLLKDPWVMHHDLSKSEDDYHAILRTLEWFMKSSDFNAYVAKLDTSKLKQKVNSVQPRTDVNFSGIVINENSDGSCDIEFEANEVAQKAILDAGVNFIFIKGILETTDTDTVLKYALRGKQQFEVDEIMNRMNVEKVKAKSK